MAAEVSLRQEMDESVVRLPSDRSGPTQLLNFTDRHYNSADEFRIAHNDAALVYGWETQDK